ncbi:MAG: DUF3105 domain-containing protein [Chloroflexi bacterium]|nr:DUF3105 domain-containing protein [Chloroflexota bacterium]
MSSDNKKWIIIGAVVIGILGLGYILYLSVRPEPTISGLMQFPRPSRGHDNSLSFAFAENPLPAAGGAHWDIWQNCGIYDEPIETGYAIHSLEHGAVWITYQPELFEDQVAELRARVEGDEFLLLSPYPGLQSPVVLTAWGLQLQVDDAADGRIDQFISRYRLGSQTPEPGAACDRGIGDPVDRIVETGNEAMDAP